MFDIAEFVNSQRALLSVIVLGSYLRMFKYLSTLMTNFGVLFIVVWQMLTDFLPFLLVYVVSMVAFSMAFHISLGADVFEYRTMMDAMMSTFRSIFGDIDYDAVRLTNPAIGSFLFVLQLFFGAILLINLLIAILNKAYEDVQELAATVYAIEKAQLYLSFYNNYTSMKGFHDWVIGMCTKKRKKEESPSDVEDITKKNKEISDAKEKDSVLRKSLKDREHIKEIVARHLVAELTSRELQEKHFSELNRRLTGMENHVMGTVRDHHNLILESLPVNKRMAIHAAAGNAASTEHSYPLHLQERPGMHKNVSFIDKKNN
eukprot:GFYU01009523.1.p1 GENE.GFYU01009523.1~~GFYU01009523.1.p1  ORF type:complete len:339 (-),score=116.09 GFYU01009523.1:115-1065(-)